MKIVYLANTAIPSDGNANSIQTMQMCEAIAAQGHQLTLLTPNYPKRLRDTNPYTYYGVQPSFAIEQLPWVALPWQRHWHGLFAALRAAMLRPQVIYGRATIACFFSVLLGIPTIFEIHDNRSIHSGMPNRMFRHMVRQPALQYIVTTSRMLKMYLVQKYHIPQAHIRVAPNAAHPPQAASNPLTLPAAHFHAGYIGGLMPGKGMEMIAQLIPLLPQVHFHIIGGNRTQIETWQNALHAHPNKTFHGYIPHAEIGKYHQAMDVLLAPYHEQANLLESEHGPSPWLSPLKIIEYMAAGKPILCSNLPAYQEVLTHEQTGLLCKPNDPQDWAQAIARLQKDPALRAQLSANARAAYQNQYTWQARVQTALGGILPTP
jgi:glycosyltransferase involved in cell wall biosynthesis